MVPTVNTLLPPEMIAKIIPKYTLVQSLKFRAKKKWHEYNLCLGGLNEYTYYQGHKEYLYSPTTLNTLELMRKSNRHKKKSRYEMVVAKPNDRNVFFRIQVWPAGMNRTQKTIRFVDDRERVSCQIMIEHNISLANRDGFFFDGKNANKLYLMGINLNNKGKNTSVLYAFKMGASKKYKGHTDIVEDNCHITALALHNNDNVVAYCTYNNKTSESLFNLGLFIEQSVSNGTNFELQDTARAVLNCPLTHIGRLTDWMHLGLDTKGRLQLIYKDQSGSTVVQEKRVWFSTVPTLSLKKGRHVDIAPNSIMIQKGDKTYRQCAEDFFTHLAVDNGTDVFGKSDSVKRDATAFVVLNREGLLFYCCLKKHFYKNKKITLWLLNESNSFNLQGVTHMWLRNNTIGLQGKKDNIEYVKTVNVCLFNNKITNY